MTDDLLIRRADEDSAAAESSHGAEWGARIRAAPLNTIGDERDSEELAGTDQT